MVKSIIGLLSTRQSTILSGAFILMIAVFASRLLGLIRDRLLAHNFDSSVTSIFFAAFRLPDLLFQLLIFGALSVAFIPVFTDYLNQKGKKEAFLFASNILNLSLLIFGIVTTLAFIFVEPLNKLLVPGFAGQQKDLTDELSRLILISELLLVIGSFLATIAQSFQRFIVPALAPLVYNLGTIFGIVLLTPYFGIKGPAIGVIVGSLLHILIQLPLLKKLEFKYHFSLNFLNQGVKEVLRLISVRNLGLVAEQINEVINTALASLISYSSITLLTFAQHLHFVPIGIFGATIAQATLPVLSKERTAGEGEAFKATFLTSLHQILFLTLPAAAILIVLRIPVVRLVFGASQFSWEDTVLTGLTVAYLSAGLVASSLVLLLMRAFYAYKDTKTPVLVSLFAIIINIGFSLLFIKVFNFEVWGLGLSSAISANISFVLLLFFLNKKIGGFGFYNLVMPFIKMFMAAVISAGALYIPIKLLDQLVFDTTKTVNLIILTGIASFIGLTIYFSLVWFMKVKELGTFIELVKKLGKLQTKIKTEEVVGDSV